MKTTRLGEFDFGIGRVVVIADPKSSDGTFRSDSGDGTGLPTISVGLKGPWGEVLSRFLHEAVEGAAIQCGVRWVPSPDYGRASDGYLFVMDHRLFTEVVARAAWLAREVVDKLSDAYKRNARGKNTANKSRHQSGVRRRAKNHAKRRHAGRKLSGTNYVPKRRGRAPRRARQA
jgi:hypothetical protein